LPSISDPDNDQYSIIVDLGPSQSFATFNYPKIKLSPGDKNNGTYNLKF